MPRTRRRADPLDRRDAATACESTRHAQRTAAPIVLAPVPRAVGLAALAAPRAAPPRRPRGDDPGGDRDRAVVPRRDGPQRRAGARRSGPFGRPARGSRGRRTRRPRCSRPRSGRASATASSRRSPGSTEADLRDGPRGARPAARLRDGRHLRRGVRGRDAVLLLDLRGGGLRARGAAGRPPGRARHRQRAGPDRAGDRVRLLRGPGRRHAPRAPAGRR